MSAFARGFQLGGDLYDSAERMKLAREQEARQAAESKARLEQMGLQTQQVRNALEREAELGRIRSEIGDYTTGLDRRATNQALDADFEAADQAALAGQALPPMVGGSNMANQTALGVRRQVDVNSPAYQAGLAGLRQRYALAAGDMKDFDAIGTAERARVTAAEDSRFALDVVRNPDGDAARNARVYINQQTRGFTIDPPNKDGISTLRIIQGDRTKPVDISPSDLSKIAVGVRRLERGDVGGLDVIAAVNKDVAAAVRAEMATQLEALKVGNDASFKIGGLNNQRAEIGLRQQQVGAMADYYRNRTGMERMGSAQYFQGEDGNQYAAIPTMGKDGLTFQTVRVNPEGIKLGGKPGARQVDPKDYSMTVQNFVNAGLDLPQAQMRADQLYGLTAPTKEVAASLQALNDAKARQGGPARASAAAPAPAPQLGLQQRLSNAIATDNAAGNRNRFADLADEGMRQMPSINAQLGALYQSLPLARTAAERASLQARITELESDASLYNGIITQRRAQMGQ